MQGGMLDPIVSGGGGGSSETTTVKFRDQNSVTVTHNLGYKPLVQINSADGLEDASVIHDSNNQFTVSFDSPQSGEILYK